MARIDDYNSYLAGRDKNFMNEHYFVCDLKYTDINIQNNAPEVLDVDDSSCEVEYEVSISKNKRGIDSLYFKIHKIELTLMVDDYPNDKKTFEFEIIPGVNIDPGLVVEEQLNYIIPSYPREIFIDMRKSMDVKDFKIRVEFGRDE